jgi:hypothetical protein
VLGGVYFEKKQKNFSKTESDAKKRYLFSRLNGFRDFLIFWFLVLTGCSLWAFSLDASLNLMLRSC